MLISVLLNEITVIRSAQELQVQHTNQYVVMAQDITIIKQGFYGMQSSHFDCRGHTLTAKAVVFQSLENVVMANCVLELYYDITEDFLTSEMRNVTVAMRNCKRCGTMSVKKSLLGGVSVTGSGRFVDRFQNGRVIGCSFALDMDVHQGSISPYYQLMQSTVQNCFFRFFARVYDANSTAAVAITSTELIFLRSRVVANFTIGTRQKGDLQISGCVQAMYGRTELQDVDITVKGDIQGAFRTISGVVSFMLSPLLNISNASVTVQLRVQGGRGATRLSVGGVVGECDLTAYVLQCVTVFADLNVSNIDKLWNVSIGGVGAIVKATNVEVSDVYAFTRVTTSLNADSACVAAAFAQTPQRFTIWRSAFIGNVHAAAHLSQLMYVAGIAAQTKETNFSHVQAHMDINVANITFEASLTAKLLSISAFIAFGQNASISACQAVGNVSVAFDAFAQSIFSIGCAAASLETNSVVQDTLVRCNLDVQITNNQNLNADGFIALLAARISGDIANSSVQGKLVMNSQNCDALDVRIAGIIAQALAKTSISNIVIIASFQLTGSRFAVATAHGVGVESAIQSVLVAVSVIGVENVNFSLDTLPDNLVNKAFADCTKTGNNKNQTYCRANANSGETATALGPQFGYYSQRNQGYPYLVALPVYDDAGKCYLPSSSSSFDSNAYFIDTKNYAFPSTTYQMCRGACYGTYVSPMQYRCANKNDYCIDVQKATADFQAIGCMSGAVCVDGRSSCKASDELQAGEDGLHACVETCAGCKGEYCQNGTCVCDPYHNGENCTTYNCTQTEPTCFGDVAQECADSGTACVPAAWCTTLGCVHGACVTAMDVDVAVNSCVCENKWTGARCDECNAFGPDCTISQQQCDALCSGHGTCTQPPQTACTCEPQYGGPNCAECALGHTKSADGRCVCGDAGACTAGTGCQNGTCVGACIVLVSGCTACSLEDPMQCAMCDKSLMLAGGYCRQKNSAAPEIALGVLAVICLAAVVVLALLLIVCKKTGKVSVSWADWKQQVF